jgi:hypothetical protein
MSNLAPYLTDVGQISTGTAIISLKGARLATSGKWSATRDEEGHFARVVTEFDSAIGKEVSYSGKRFVVNRAIEDTVFARLGKEGLVLQKASLVFVAAHYGEGQIGSDVCSRVAQAVIQLHTHGH